MPLVSLLLPLLPLLLLLPLLPLLLLLPLVSWPRRTAAAMSA